MTTSRRINRVMLAGVIGIAALGGSAPGRASFNVHTSRVLRTADAALAAHGEVQQRTQLQTARELLDLAARPWPNALSEAVALAKAGTAAQSSLALDVAATSTAQIHASPAQAAVALAALNGVNADQGQLARLGQIAGPLRDALTHLIDAFASMQMTARVAFGSVDIATEPALAGVLAARNRMLDAVLGLRAAMGHLPAVQAACSPLEVSSILSIDIAACDNTYSQDVALLVDAGGDDRYLNNAGGSGVVSEPCSLEGAGLGGAGALIDLAGDDSYGDPADPRNCGANGGGYSGAGFLVDVGGNDTYIAGGGGTNGGSYGGSGFLLDVAGSDTYTAGGAGTNGGSCQGDAFLLDVAGDETYGAEGDCTNGGGGFLVDLAGTDTYTAESYATNGGGTSGLHGFLLDAGGNDTYIAGSFGTNGGGAQPGVGGVGTGFLLDAGGNDTYVAGDGATNGGGWQGAGFLLDAEGDDSYVAGHVAPNGAGDSRGGAGAGLLLDAEGADTYLDEDGGTGTDCTRAPKGTFGAQVDLPHTAC